MAENTDQDRTDDTGESRPPTLGDVAKSQESGSDPANSDLHGAAREVAEDASGDGPAKTPGG